MGTNRSTEDDSHIIITSSQIDHNVLIPVEEHRRARVVQLVHAVEIGYLVDVHQVNHGEVLDLLGYAEQDLVLDHADLVGIATEAYDHDAIFLGQDGLVDLPSAAEMGQHVRHDDNSITDFLSIPTMGVYLPRGTRRHKHDSRRSMIWG